MSRAADDATARWIGKVSIDAPDFPHYLVDAAHVASLSTKRKAEGGVVKHHVHDFRIDLWRAGTTVFYGEYYLDDPDVLDTKRGRDAFGAMLFGLPAHRKKSLGVVRIASGALALVFAHLPRATITPADVVAAARGRALKKHPLADLDGDIALLPLAPGKYEVIVEHLGTKKAPVENAWGALETRTVLVPR